MSGPALALPAHAKLNLELTVTGRLEGGEHSIDTIFQAISLHDVLELEVADETSLEVIAGDAPSGPENLVLRAAAELERAAGRSLPARFRLLKRIPTGAGLGGGSSDAATALRGLERLYGLKVDLGPVAARLGADVAFFLKGGAARGQGRGELLTSLPTSRGAYALAWPGFAVSTAAVYRAWDEVGGEGRNQLARAAFKVEPRLVEFAARLGERWQLTGSGGAFFRACISQPEAAAAIAPLDCWTSVAAPVAAW